MPGSNIHSEMAGKAAVLTGTVRTPLDAKRAADIACQFVAANKQRRQAVGTSGGANSTNVAVDNQRRAVQSSNTRPRPSSRPRPAAATRKLVINLLTVEGEEQVMLKVTVAEVQRAILKQFGINLGAAINSGNFATAILTENALPLTAAAGLGKLPIPGLGTAGCDPTQPSRARPRAALQLEPGSAGSSLRQLRRRPTASTAGNTQPSPAPCARSSATA